MSTSPRKEANIRWLAVILLTLGISVAACEPSHAASTSLARFRQTVWATHPCAAWIIDREQGGSNWSTTVYNGGSHWHKGDTFDTSRSYGLGQAFPGTKMLSAGRDWKTNPWTQLRWALGYMRDRYGSECGAKAFWIAHSWY